MISLSVPARKSEVVLPLLAEDLLVVIVSLLVHFSCIFVIMYYGISVLKVWIKWNFYCFALLLNRI